MPIKKTTREVVHKKFNSRCGYCGIEISFKEMQVDHVVPQCEFPVHIKNQFRVPGFLKHLCEVDVDHIDNLMPACRVCNKWKSAHDLEFFRSEIQAQVKRLNNYSSNYRMAKKYNLVTEKETLIKFYFEQL